MDPDPDTGVVPADLRRVLESARQRHLLGAVPVDDQVAHALGFAQAAGTVPRHWMDLGSGGGLPGLVLAWTWPDSSGVLLDSAHRRTEFLEEAIRSLAWRTRLQVVCARAEEAGRDPALRETFDLVVARSFGPPAVTAECAAPFLRVGGLLVVSEPPRPDRPVLDEHAPPTGDVALDGTAVGGSPPDPGTERWRAEELAELGLEPLGPARARFGYQVLVQVNPCPTRFPRRPGMATKRPLYRTQG